MRAVPTNIETAGVVAAVAAGWGFVADDVEYAAVGAGSYHWVVRDRDGTRRFATVDDLDQKAWLGDTRDAVLAGLRRAFDTASALRDDAGLAFVVAPLPTLRGGTLCRLGPRHTVALFPFVEGTAGRFGHYDESVREDLLSLLAELHHATPAVASTAAPIGLALPGRPGLLAGLQELDEPWAGGPFSEPARQALAAHAADVADLVALADRLAAVVEERRADWVVTHGEPHPANVILTGERLLLVDWDTVGLAPRERDLWMLVAGTATAHDTTPYTEATGHELDQDAVDFFRLTWDLKDLAEYLNVLRSHHVADADSAQALEGLENCVSSRDRWRELLE